MGPVGDRDNQSTTEDYTSDFAQVLAREYSEIRLRRAQTTVASTGSQAGTGVAPEAPPELYGVALSGGGIRSASFCLGALQALDRQGLAERIDYLSTVSGGGYTGASMISAMQQNGGRFPFSRDREREARDNEPVAHLRDNSRFLAPHGLSDLLISLAVILRGLVVNIILVLALLFPLATLLVLANPTKAHLEHSIVLDLGKRWLSDGQRETPLYQALAPYLEDPFLMSKTLLAALAIVLFAWALGRSFAEFRGLGRDRPVPEPMSLGARWGLRLIIMLAVALFLELQPPILFWLMNLLEAEGAATGTTAGGPVSVTGMLGTIGAAIVALTATFRATFVGWITKALNAPTLGTWLKALFARTLIYTAGLILPLMIYGFFLLMTVWGIRASTAGYAFAPEVLAVANGSVLAVLVYLLLAAGLAAVLGRSLAQSGVDLLVALLVAGLAAVVTLSLGAGWLGRVTVASFFDVVALGIAAVLVGRVLVPTIFPDDIQRGWRDWLRVLLVAGWGWTAAMLVAIVFLILSAIATRSGGPAVEWIVLFRYTVSMLLVWCVGWQFAENANGLHRLYRDRIAAAFRLSQADNVPLRLSALTGPGPYLLVNATLNAKVSDATRDANTQADPDFAGGTMDPAKRGRNAEFFLFSSLHVGSASTGYAKTTAMEAVDAKLDIATAAAISGAAVSSSMGRINIGLLAPTLALLNLRLGYWLTNPKLIDPGYAFGNERRRAWHDRFRLYLFAEAFGLLRTNSPRVYVTDGGHIDNLGLYQLLKRRCRYIVVIDGEADPAMTFGALSDLQRFARIDEGVRITLDWMPIRDAALARMADRTKRAAPDQASHDQHFAVGKILYESKDGQIDEGLLIYVKASMTGDEPDYVLDYERRYPLFPHESTGDQFFSEEQMEAYRALGYHCVSRALNAEKNAASPVRCSAHPDGEDGPVTRMIRALKPTAPA